LAGLNVKSQEQKEILILEMKQSAEEYGLLKDLPEEFRKYFKHVCYSSLR
jgi:hypothetical protein